MADKLPWFPFYPQDWMTDPQVLGLTGDQMAAFLWLLCLQWREGHLPYEAHLAVPMVARSIDPKAVVYVLLNFFPPDPDTNERRNLRLEVIRAEQEAKQEANRAKTAKARSVRHRKGVSVTEAVTETESESETETEELPSDRELSTMDLATQCAVTANAALRDNPAVRSKGDLWVLNAAKARQCAEDWSRDGIPENVVLGAITAVCGAFQPSPENPRIGSFRYFDAAVRKAWKDAQQGDALDEAFRNLK